MLTKKLNATILIASQILNFVIILYFAVLLAKLVWWVINPSIGEVYVEKTSATQFDKSIKYIINRYPFGVITKAVEAKSVAPPIASQIKLTGIYFNPPNSIAFIEYTGKAHTVKVNGSIMSDAVLTAINENNVVVTQNKESAVVNLSAGSGTATSVTVATDRGLPMVQSNTPSTSPSPANITGATTSGSDDFKERRKKLIEEFTQPGSSPAAGHENTQTPASATTAPGATTPPAAAQAAANGGDSGNNSNNSPAAK